MTAREFLEWAGYEGDLEHGLFLLSQYVGRGNFYLQFPDADVLTQGGLPLEEMPDEPVEFQEYLEANT